MKKQTWVQYAVLATIVWALLVFLCHFTIVQSTVLALIVATIAPIRPFSTPRGFVPFFVRFSPHVGNMLLDMGLIETADEYSNIAGEPLPFVPWKPEHIYHYSIRAVCISFDPVTGFTMTHFPDSGGYTTTMEWECQLPGVPFRNRIGNRLCQFTIRSRPNGIHFGIEVDDDWWKANKANVKAKVKGEKIEFGTGSAYISLAVFPFGELEEYYVAVSSKRRDEIDKLLKDNDWETDDYQIPEMGRTYTTYKHQYIDVYHHRIE